MRQIRQENEIERGRIRSLAVIAVSFVMANVFLIFGFSKVAAAQTLDASFNLATMLAAPNISIQSGNEQVFLMVVMSIGLVVMTVSSIAFLRGFVNDTKA
ncbi:MAG: hypothetical protein AAGF25_09725 [Pseudomonadota bacterium]